MKARQSIKTSRRIGVNQLVQRLRVAVGKSGRLDEGWAIDEETMN